MLKRLLKTGTVQFLLAWMTASYIRLVCRTTRWRVHGQEHVETFWQAKRPFIGCFWHGRLLAMRASWPRAVPVHLLISSHSDGRLIAETMRRLGVGTVAGSTKRGGAGAFLALRRKLSGGESIAITPDGGTRGPRMRVAPGVIKLASLTETPVVPAAFSSTRQRVLHTWDRFVLALPFGRGVYVYGAPLTVPRDADPAALEAARCELEIRLNRVTAEADRLCGWPTIEPEPTAAEIRARAP